MRYPTTVIDNFLPDPDEIVRFMNRCAFEEDMPMYPGKRTKHIHLLDMKLHEHLDYKICSLFKMQKTSNISSAYFFQKIEPQYPKWDERSCDMIHVDSPCEMGGVIYLDKDPDPDAGTSTYNQKNFIHMPTAVNQLWWDLYAGKDIDVEKYKEEYHKYTDQFEETVTVKNRYNRLILFDGTTYHRCPTHGDKTRHTIVFFFGDPSVGPNRYENAPPLNRVL